MLRKGIEILKLRFNYFKLSFPQTMFADFVVLVLDFNSISLYFNSISSHFNSIWSHFKALTHLNSTKKMHQLLWPNPVGLRTSL